jgi:predicted enzyme related to lactoylglutathione lyase
MPVSHFAINADDLSRARRFYEKVFGWSFESFGPPDFFRIHDKADKSKGNFGALQKRRELAPGKHMIGFECTFAVDDVGAVAKLVRAQGGKILMERTVIMGVGELIFCEDTEGNVFGAMHYDPKAE